MIPLIVGNRIEKEQLFFLPKCSKSDQKSVIRYQQVVLKLWVPEEFGRFAFTLQQTGSFNSINDCDVQKTFSWILD